MCGRFTLTVSAGLLAEWLRGGRVDLRQHWEWTPALGAEFTLRADGLSLLFVALIGLIGALVLTLPTGTYEMELRPPFQSRYLLGEVSTFVITEDVDLGDAEMDSGYFVEGRIVDGSGNGLTGVEVSGSP